MNIYDSERNPDDKDSEIKILYNRVNELEQIINEYKKTINDSTELKLVNNQTFQLPAEVLNIK